MKGWCGAQGLALEQRSPQIDGVLGALLAKLEKDKPGIGAGPGDQQYCENFAVCVFSRADRVDRAGKADKNTATTFYAASIFMEVSFSCPNLPHGQAVRLPARTRSALCVRRPVS